MLEIIINEEKTIVENTIMRCKWTLNTSDFFGDVFYKLEHYFPEISPKAVEENIKHYYLGKLNGKPVEPPGIIFGCAETGETLLNLIGYIEDTTKHDKCANHSYISPTLKELEEFRIANRMASNYLPDRFDEENSIRFSNLDTVTHVLIASLYFYAYHDYKIARCQHCGKWYATKTLKKKYCNRISPCFGSIIKGKESLSCEQAVRNILQKCSRIKNRIETKTRQTAAAQRHESIFEDNFRKQCEHFYKAAKSDPTVENLTNYHNFLEATEKEKGWINNG